MSSEYASFTPRPSGGYMGVTFVFDGRRMVYSWGCIHRHRTGRTAVQCSARARRAIIRPNILDGCT